MADERKHIDDPDRPLAASNPDDTTVVMDEFVAPEDVVGEDLAEELQRVLDEAQGALNEPSAGLTDPAMSEAAADALDDDGVFESPDEVISAQAAANEALEHDATIASANEVTRQLEAMNALIQQTANQQPAAPSAPAPAAVGPMKELESDDEFHSPADLGITDETTAAASPASVAAADELDMLEQIRQMSGRPKAPGPGETTVVSPAATASNHTPAASTPAAATPTLGQLDEVLAAQADHAVADEFETVHDVLAVQQSADDAAKIAAAPVVAANEATGATPQQAAPVAPSAAASAVAAAPAVSPVPLPGTPAGAPQASAAAPALAAPVAPPPAAGRRRLAAMIQRASQTCSAGLYRACVVISAPTRRTSDTTRNIIGYAGLITLGNALLLLLGKLILG